MGFRLHGFQPFQLRATAREEVARMVFRGFDSPAGHEATSWVEVRGSPPPVAGQDV